MTFVIDRECKCLLRILSIAIDGSKVRGAGIQSRVFLRSKAFRIAALACELLLPKAAKVTKKAYSLKRTITCFFVRRPKPSLSYILERGALGEK